MCGSMVFLTPVQHRKGKIFLSPQQQQAPAAAAAAGSMSRCNQPQKLRF
jgi:hypothetical protein